MGEYIKVIPKDGASVKHPDNFAVIPQEGRRVRAAAYWQRMEKQGLVTIEQIDEESQSENKSDENDGRVIPVPSEMKPEQKSADKAAVVKRAEEGK